MSLEAEELAVKKIESMTQKSYLLDNSFQKSLEDTPELGKSMLAKQGENGKYQYNNNDEGSVDMDKQSGMHDMNGMSDMSKSDGMMDGVNKVEGMQNMSKGEADMASVLKKMIHINEETYRKLSDFKESISKMLSEQMQVLNEMSPEGAVMQRSLNSTVESIYQPENSQKVEFGGKNAQEVSLQQFGIVKQKEDHVQTKMANLSKSMAYDLLDQVFDSQLSKEYQMRLTVVHQNNFEKFFDAQRTSIQQQILEKLQSTQQ